MVQMKIRKSQLETAKDLVKQIGSHNNSNNGGYLLDYQSSLIK